VDSFLYSFADEVFATASTALTAASFGEGFMAISGAAEGFRRELSKRRNEEGKL
jgi:hypothetical protein